jgi:hypothetical protein
VQSLSLDQNTPTGANGQEKRLRIDDASLAGGGPIGDKSF